MASELSAMLRRGNNVCRWLANIRLVEGLIEFIKNKMKCPSLISYQRTCTVVFALY